MGILIRQATPTEVGDVVAVLSEAAAWLEQRGIPLWQNSELLPERIQEDVAAGLFYVADAGHEIAGVIKFQLEDPTFWPEALPQEAAYIHRLAVRRRYAGKQISTQLLDWAVARTRALHRQYLRMDTEANRSRLRAIYEEYGFAYHSERQVGTYFVARYQYAI